MTDMRLIGRRGWGSVLVEAQLEFYGLAYDFVEVRDLFQSETAREELAKLNPLAQVPTLMLADGSIMTESAAITLHLADLTGSDELVPGANAPQRAQFLRWLIYLVANIYPTFTYADVPERFVPEGQAAQAFRRNVDAYGEQLWRHVEAETSKPWFLEARFSALDIYICAMSRWRPRRPWFEANAPCLLAIAKCCDDLPKLKAVWERNFPAES